MGNNFPALQSVVVDLAVDRVSLVNQGANARADILLMKRRENEEMPKTFEELMAVLEPAHAELIKGHLAELSKETEDAIEALNKTVEDLTAQIEKAAEKPEVVEPEEEDILKSTSPEVAAYIQELQKSVNALVEDKAESIAKARFEEVKALPVEEETLKTVLKSASPAVYEVLKQAATAVEAAVLDKAKGKDLPNDTFHIDADAAYATLEKSAKEIMKSNEEISFEQAFVEACTNDPATYAKYYEKGVK